jgi:hypothetical protein
MSRSGTAGAPRSPRRNGRRGSGIRRNSQRLPMDLRMIETGWTPVWAMPNVTLDEAITAYLLAQISSASERR